MKRLLLQLLTLLTLVVGVQVAMYLSNGGDSRLFPKQLLAYQRAIDDKPDVIYFGDSVNRSSPPGDQDQRAISDMIQEINPSHKVGSVDHGAYHAALYLEFVKNLLGRGVRPKAMVVPINLRSFSTGWASRPEYQFSKERFLLAHDQFLVRAFFKPLAVFKAVQLTPVTQDEYERMDVMDGGVRVGPVKQFIGPAYENYSDRFLTNKLVFHYMYDLSADHEFLTSLVKLSRIAKKNNVPVVYYVTPVDYQTGEKYLGPRFTEQLKRNVQLIQVTLAAERVVVLDLSLALPTEEFGWRTDLYPNEHLRDTGRRFVAQSVVEGIRAEQ